MNTEFQRIGRRDKRAFLSDQCKEIEENNRMGKIRDLLKKIRYTEGIFHAKMGTIKGRNGMDLTESKDIYKNTEKNYTKKIFMTQITTMMWSLTKRQTYCNAKSSGTREASPQTKLVEVMESQLSYFKS